MSRWQVLLIIVLTLGGCANGPDASSLSPFFVERVEIYEGQQAGVLDPRYVGTLFYPHCIGNTNVVPLRARAGSEAYQVQEPLTEMKLVEEQRFDSFRVIENRSFAFDFSNHIVLANETATGGTRYAIHLWVEMLLPSPAHRLDRWYNVTYTPFGNSRLYEEGNASDCNVGLPE